MPEVGVSRCTAQRPNGTFCDRPSLPGAPFPICLKHAALAYQFVVGRIPDTGPEFAVAALSALVESQTASHATPEVVDAVIYYMQVGPFIKIGTTTTLARRLRSYPPDSVLLAIEPGGYDVERARHHQFNADRAAGREWFRPSEALSTHIEYLQRRAPEW